MTIDTKSLRYKHCHYPFKNDIKLDGKPTVKPINVSPSSIYLDYPVIEAYLNACEITAYYQSLKHVLGRRETHAQLLTTLETLNLYLLKDNEAQLLETHYLKNRNARKGGSTKGSAFSYLKKVARTEVKLMNLTAPVDESALKRCYRQSAKRFHPDKGGDTETMQKLNAAFKVLHNLLLEWRLGEQHNTHETDGLRSMHTTTSIQELKILLHQHFYKIHLDDFEFVKAFHYMCEYQEQLNNYRKKKKTDRFLIYSKLTIDATKVAKHLAKSEYKDIAQKALAFAIQCANKEKLLSDSSWAYYRQKIQQAKDAIHGIKKPRLVINHPRQARAALQLRLINEKRFKTLEKRFQKKNNEQRQKQILIEKFANEIGFLVEVSPNLIKPKNRPKGLVKDTQYYESGLRFLDNDQRLEYAWTFYKQPDIDCIQRYMHTRIDEILRYVILREGHKQMPLVINECVALWQVEKTSFSHSIAEQTATTLKWLDGLPELEKNERILLLKSLHNIAPEAAHRDYFSQMFSSGPDWRLCISTNHTFFELITAPIHVLKKMENSKRFISKTDWVLK